ncbi:MAG: LamG-like jellyroll fold domain-containing protein, partial [Roseibacillus sp.]
GGIGFGYSNAASSFSEFDYSLIGGGAVFDTDGNGDSYGSLIISFDPNIDTDGDGIPDGQELNYPGITDLTQLGPGDFDGDGVNDLPEIAAGTDPTNPDTDGDGLGDKWEIDNGTDPLVVDTDGDGLSDGDEVNSHGTDPLVVDTDGDGFSDGSEVQLGTDPNNSSSRPNLWEVDLVAYWQQDGNHNNWEELVDDYHGTADGSAIPFETGLFGDAAHLNGSHSIIIGGDENAFDFAGQSMTVSAWFTADVIDLGWQCLIAKGEGNGWRLHRRGGDNPPEMAWAAGAADIPKNNVAITIGANPEFWHHVVGVTDSATMVEILYLDGIEIGRLGGATLENRGNPMRIGENPDALGRAWKGKIDDVAIWNRPLDVGEIAVLYNSGLDGKSLKDLIIPPGDTLGLQVRRDEAGMLELSWNSIAGFLYNIRSETDLSAGGEDGSKTWPIYNGHEDLEATPDRNVIAVNYPADPGRFFVVEEFPKPPVVVFEDNFDGRTDLAPWTNSSPDGNPWELGVPTAVLGPLNAFSPPNAVGTVLAGNYVASDTAGTFVVSSLLSPAISLSGIVSGTISYQRYGDMEDPQFDYVEAGLVSADGSLIAVLETDIGNSSLDWEAVSYEIPAAAIG